MSKYKCGLYIGRFQPVHRGHWSIISRMMRECDTVILAIGSPQQHGTKKNPFSYALRARMLDEVVMQSGYKYENAYIIPVEDREHPSNDASWGNYLLDRVRIYTGLIPDVIYEGEEVERRTWYDNLDISVERIPRNVIPVSGTDIRQYLIDGNLTMFNLSVPYPILSMFMKLREEILKCYDSPKT